MGENAIFMLTAVAALLSESAEKDHAFLDTEAQLYIKINNALNLSYDEWGNFLGNPTMVDALLSRVRHYCHTIRIDGPSLRDPQG